MSKADCNTCLTTVKIRIGTSGWYYDHWKERFYPADLPRSKWFEYYARHFDTVEINNTFYHLPKEQTLQRWHKIAPKDFLYAVKANRYITHIKRLKGTAEPLVRFFDRVGLLKSRLGPILYQLPPSMHKDLDLLESFIKLLPKRKTAVFEFRHESWYEDDTFELLEKSGAGFCIHDMPGKESPRIVTGDIIYVRFHGTTGRYSGSYPKSQLQSWANWLKDQTKKVRAIYIYFNNDEHAHAIKNAKQLKGLF
ncbi:MAG: DUF72 domain-containing protein [Planctomycetota bacterium]|jgi:uncharacterized protein YecE (DUF72 family)